MLTNQHFDEVRVFDGVAERTGNTVDRSTVRRSRALCRSLTELTRKFRKDGDGYFYLAVHAWPADKASVVLTEEWKTMS